MDRTTRTAIILLALGGFAAVGSLMLQSFMIKKLPPGKLQAAAAAKGAAAAPKFAAPAPVAAAPVVPPPVAAPPAPPPLSDAARACREKLSACLTANGKALTEQDSLGQCYTLCVGAAGPCDKASCGDLCEAAFGVRETCR
jgi:hypothetical protein